MPAHEELLRRHQPQLRYDSNEAFFADSAAEWTDNPTNVLRRRHPNGSEEVLAAARPDPGQQQLSLDFLGHPSYANGEPSRKEDEISDTIRGYRDQYVALRRGHPEYKNRMYGRAKEDSNGRLWLQYWFFYFYNDYQLAGGFGLHEGDWEMVQLRMGDDGPDLAVYAQHDVAERRPWDRVSRKRGSPETPLVFVARGSHASYFEKGYHETKAWYDIADGRRRTPVLTLEIVGDTEPSWITWPGRWGDTRPKHPPIDQPSPTGPCAKKQWDDPKRLLENAQTPTRRSGPAAPNVTVERRGGYLHIEYDFSKRRGIPPERLVVTVNSADDALQPRTFTYRVEPDLRGSIPPEVPLNDTQEYDINVSTVDPHGRPSESDCTILYPAGARPWRSFVGLSQLKRIVAAVQGFVGRRLGRR